MSSNFANFWQKRTPRNLEQTQTTTSRFIVHMFVLYRVNSSNSFYGITVGLQHQIRRLHIKVKLSHQVTFTLSEQVFKVSSISSHTGTQPSTLYMVDCLADDTLMQTRTDHAAIKRR